MPTTPVAESAFLTGIFDKLPILEAATTSRVVVNNAVLRHVTRARCLRSTPLPGPSSSSC